MMKISLISIMQKKKRGEGGRKKSSLKIKFQKKSRIKLKDHGGIKLSFSQTETQILFPAIFQNLTESHI